MRGSLMRRWTKEEHIQNLTNRTGDEAAAVYSQANRGTVSGRTARYWRKIFIDNAGNLAATDRELAAARVFLNPEPDDDIGTDLHLPEVAHSILVIPDQHAPYHHPDFLDFLTLVKKTFEPDLVVNLGDEADYHAMSFHDSDPNLDSAGTELEKAKVFMQRLHSIFPNQLICHSNHGSMQYRRAKAHGIPVQMIKRYRDVLMPEGGAPGWHWKYCWRVQTPTGTVMFKHQSAGSILQDAAHNQCNLVVGHNHGNFSIEYASSSALLYWGMYSGCGIDKDSLAFAYGKHSRNKPIVGCSVILEGRPVLIPMIMDEDANWIGRL